jgi:cell fate regulator YaaT (PSP1 superfamily)
METPPSGGEGPGTSPRSNNEIAPDSQAGGPPPGNAVAIVGVRLQGRARVAQFNSAGIDFRMGERVVVEGDQGIDIGEVVQPTTHARKMCSIGCMKKALRVAGEEDLKGVEQRGAVQKEAKEYCLERIRERKMPMKLVRVEQILETRKLVFFFTAEGRVDFRDLVRDLAQRMHTRIEMRQIGVRDEAGILGGYGPCGKALCCSTFLKEFAPISIKMAKAQHLSLNPSKLSGMCGRLKCCLRYEYQPPGGDATVSPEDETLPPAPPDNTAPPASTG